MTASGRPLCDCSLTRSVLPRPQSNRMPKSKREKVVSLTKVKKRSREQKGAIIDELREWVSTNPFVYIFSVANMKNEPLKTVRNDWRGRGRFFLGKNKLMAHALGRDANSELRPGLHHVSIRIVGNNLGLFVTSAAPAEVLRYFEEFEAPHFATSGFIATEPFMLHSGVLEDQPFSIEPQLRALGLPTRLKDGVVMLDTDVEVCKVGDTLTPEQCRVLKLFGIEMAVFKIRIECVHVNGRIADLTNASPQLLQSLETMTTAAAPASSASSFDTKHHSNTNTAPSASASASAFPSSSGGAGGGAISMSSSSSSAAGKAKSKKSKSAAVNGDGDEGEGDGDGAFGSDVRGVLDDGTEVLDWNDGTSSASTAASVNARTTKTKSTKPKGKSTAATMESEAVSTQSTDTGRGRSRAVKPAVRLTALAAANQPAGSKGTGKPDANAPALPFSFDSAMNDGSTASTSAAAGGATTGSATAATNDIRFDEKVLNSMPPPSKRSASKGKSKPAGKSSANSSIAGKMKTAKKSRPAPF